MCISDTRKTFSLAKGGEEGWGVLSDDQNENENGHGKLSQERRAVQTGNAKGKNCLNQY